jgi:transcriptional regulator with XRE-family HTH domain
MLTKAERLFLKRLGLRLREVRQAKKWTLEETENHGDISWRHLQKIESGKNITLTTLFRLSQLYKTKMDDFLRDL